MRDSACQTTDRLHLGSVPHAFFKLFPFRDIDDGRQDSVAAGRMYRGQAHLDRKGCSIFSQAMQFPPGSHGSRLRR